LGLVLKKEEPRAAGQTTSVKEKKISKAWGTKHDESNMRERAASPMEGNRPVLSKKGGRLMLEKNRVGLTKTGLCQKKKD